MRNHPSPSPPRLSRILVTMRENPRLKLVLIAVVAATTALGVACSNPSGTSPPLDIEAMVQAAVQAALPSETATATPDVEAIVAAQVQATVEALQPPPPPTLIAPTLVPLPPQPTPSPEPTVSPSPTATSPPPTRTSTPPATATVVPTVAPTPTALPTPTPTPPTPTATGIVTVADVVRIVSLAVVKVRTLEGTGSGVIIESSGYVLTNYHVANGQDPSVILNDGTALQATLVGFDEPKDLAILHIGSGQDFPSLLISAQSTIQLGDEVIALGYPVGLGLTVTKGIVSAFVAGDDVEYIQTDTAVNPGNSGGPLVDSEGRLVGLVTSRIVSSGGRPVQNVGFAILLRRELGTVDSLIGGVAIAKPSATPVTTKRILNYPKGYAIEVPRRWTQQKLTQGFDWLFRGFKAGDWLFWVDRASDSAVISIRYVDAGASKYSAESYMEQLITEELGRGPYQDAAILQVAEITLTNGIRATQFEITVDYGSPQNIYRGTYPSTWIVAVFDDRTIAVEALMFGDDSRIRDELEAALATLELFQPG